ncbi:TROVE domain-containing protein [Bacillus sp. NPDC077411]|uniref:TROVE domain-containing protein n=1 Tax=Bacillus bruguierae TaxID=3127667 RepID=A0ABU8FRD4_9BACI
MSKFNHSSQGSRQTYTKEGGNAYKMYDKDKLVTMVLTSFFNEPKFYGDNSGELVTTAKQIMDRDPKFVANLAVYAREVFYMRSVTHVLAVELANHPEGRKYARQTVSRIAQRPDDVTEMMAYQLGVYGRKNPIPNSLKKGLADAFATFDEYQLAKYNRTGKDVTLKDVFRLVSPSAKEGTERYELYKRLLENTLQVPYTWETQLSQKGNKKEVWEELIDSGKVGYMALLRNLRNIVDSDAANIDTVYNILRDPERVKKSKQLPFRFFSAYRVVQEKLPQAGSELLDVLNDAIEASVTNMPRVSGTTFMTADISGSMTYNSVSKDGTVTCADIATLMMAMAHSFCDNSITSVFATDFKVINVSTRSGILENMNTFLSEVNKHGYGTNLYLSIQYLLDNKIKVDRILVFSDEQVYGDEYEGNSLQILLETYRREVNPDVWVHSFNLNSYGNQQFVGGKTNLIGGWSEKSLDFIRYAEEGTGSLISAIENYQ